MRMTGGRVDRFRHLLYETWKATKVEMAVLAELLLRGPQTKGELRSRASRMDADRRPWTCSRTCSRTLASRRLVVT